MKDQTVSMLHDHSAVESIPESIEVPARSRASCHQEKPTTQKKNMRRGFMKRLGAVCSRTCKNGERVHDGQTTAVQMSSDSHTTKPFGQAHEQDDDRKHITTDDSRRALLGKSLLEHHISSNSLSHASTKTSNTESMSRTSASHSSRCSVGLRELEARATPPVTSILEASSSSMAWDPPFPAPLDNAPSKKKEGTADRRGSRRSSRMNKKKRSKSMKSFRTRSRSLRRYGSDGEDSLKRSTRHRRFQECLSVRSDDHPPTLEQVRESLSAKEEVETKSTKADSTLDSNGDDLVSVSAPTFVSVKSAGSGKSRNKRGGVFTPRKCICGRGDECTGMSAAFHILHDPRGSFTKVPRLRSDVKSHFDFSMNRLRKLLLQSLLSPEEIESFDNESPEKRRYVANHHFHPKLVSWAAEGDSCDIPMCVSKKEMIKLHMGLTDEYLVLNKEHEPTTTYHVVPNYDRERTRKDLKHSLKSTVLKLRSADKKLIARMSSRKLTELTVDDKRLIKKMSSRDLMDPTLKDDGNMIRRRSSKKLKREESATSISESLDKLIEARRQVSQRKLTMELTGDSSSHHNHHKRSESVPKGTKENSARGSGKLHALRKNRDESRRKLQQLSNNLSDHKNRGGHEDPAPRPTSTPRPSLRSSNSYPRYLSRSMEDLLKSNSVRSQASSEKSDFIASFPSGEDTQETMSVSDQTSLSGEIGVSLPPKPEFLKLDKNEKDVMHSKLSAFESRRRSVFHVKMMATCLQWRSSVDGFEAGLNQTASAEHWVYEASNATHNVVHDVILGNGSDDSSHLSDMPRPHKALAASSGDVSNPVPVFSGYVSSCIADELRRARPQLETRVNNMERTGQAILSELESAEVRAIEAWDAYDAIAASSYKTNENDMAVPENSEEVSTKLWAVQMRYRVAVANQSLAWKMSAPKLSNLFDSVEKAEKERRDWLRGLLVEVLSRTPSNAGSQPAVDKIQEIIRNIETGGRSSSSRSLGAGTEQPPGNL